MIEECFQPVRRVKAVRRRRFGPGLSRPFTKHLRPADVTDPTAGEPGHQFTIRQCLNHPIGCSRRRTGQAHQGSDRGQWRREIGKRHARRELTDRPSTVRKDVRAPATDRRRLRVHAPRRRVDQRSTTRCPWRLRTRSRGESSCRRTGLGQIFCAHEARLTGGEAIGDTGNVAAQDTVSGVHAEFGHRAVKGSGGSSRSGASDRSGERCVDKDQVGGKFSSMTANRSPKNVDRPFRFRLRFAHVPMVSISVDDGNTRFSE